MRLESTSSSSRLPAVSRRMVLREQVKEHIVEAILSGELNPGERLVESALARQLGVSQAPIREAIRDLVMMGFLETKPYKGASVRTFSARDLHEIYSVRAALEALATREAAAQITDEDIRALRQIYQRMLNAAKSGDLVETTRLNNEFHEYILQRSGNHLIVRLWKTLLMGQWTVYSARHSELGLMRIAERHQDVIDALATRDPHLAEEAMRRHIEEVMPPESPEP